MNAFAYVHGFASGPQSQKGQALARSFAEHGLTLHVPDLNRPSFSRLTISGALAALDDLAAAVAPDDSWSFIGSSFGGYVASRWAQLHGERVARLLLLCPAFDLPDLWTQALGESGLARWKAEGFYTVEDVEGIPTPVAWQLMEDGRRHPPYPRVTCPVRVIHGTRDEVVPLVCSERFVAKNPQAHLETVEDDHSLLASLPQIASLALSFLAGVPTLADP